MKFTREDVISKIKDGFDFKGVALRGLDLSRADLKNGKFQGVNFRYTDLREADLSNADMRTANLRHVVLIKANLSGADLSMADLTHADLRGASLVNTKLKDAKLDGAKGISEKVFFTQSLIDSLVQNNKMTITGDVITILTKKNASFNIVPALRFVKIEAGDDSLDVLGKVKTEKEVKELKVEIMRNSAVYGDTVYIVEPGYIGIPIFTETALEQEAKPEQDKKASMQMLAEFILKNI
ncbi:MAG TPA: pentapeptide repeat-containing protein [bacterium]